MAFSADGKTLGSGSSDATAKLWTVSTGREVSTLKGQADEVLVLAFSADGNTLVSGSADGMVRLWRAASFAETDTPAGTRHPSP